MKIESASELKKELIHQLPYLRRYARALTGSRDSGDVYVRGCLEIILQEPDRLSLGDDVRVQLFRLFHEIWSIFDKPLRNSEEGGDSSANFVAGRVRERVQSLALPQRQALLLVHSEGFSVSATAEILNISQDLVRQRVAQAWEDLKRQESARVLIIEDEPVIALDLAQTVTEMGHVIVGVATRSDNAIALARSKRPSLVLADIRLEDGFTGPLAVQAIVSEISVPVVFVTAYPERLLTGDGVEPTFLVSKPFDTETLQVAISQALFCGGAQPAHRPVEPITAAG